MVEKPKLTATLSNHAKPAPSTAGQPHSILTLNASHSQKVYVCYIFLSGVMCIQPPTFKNILICSLKLHLIFPMCLAHPLHLFVQLVVHPVCTALFMF